MLPFFARASQERTVSIFASGENRAFFRQVAAVNALKTGPGHERVLCYVRCQLFVCV